MDWMTIPSVYVTSGDQSQYWFACTKRRYRQIYPWFIVWRNVREWATEQDISAKINLIYICDCHIWIQPVEQSFLNVSFVVLINLPRPGRDYQVQQRNTYTKIVDVIIFKVRRWLSSGMLLVETDRRFSGAHCLHHQGDPTRLHGATSQKTAVFIIVAVRTLNLNQI
jgi:hypothetical protein